MVQKNHDRYPCKPRYLAGNAYLYSKKRRGARHPVCRCRFPCQRRSDSLHRDLERFPYDDALHGTGSAALRFLLCFCSGGTGASVPRSPLKTGPKGPVYLSIPLPPLPKQAAPVHFLQHLYPVRGEAKIAFLRIAHPPSCGLFAGSVPAPRFETAGASSF